MSTNNMHGSALKSDAQYERTEFLSRDGYEVVVAADYWRLSKDVAFNLDWLSEYLGDDMRFSFKQVLAIYAQTCSSKHAINLHARLKVRIPRHSDTQPTLIRTPVPRSFGQAVGAQRRRGGIVSLRCPASSISASVCALIHPSD